ncbi:MAG: hypothetical protein AAF485_21510 [Chloroflexota bacterium]
MKVTFLYYEDCPSHDVALERLCAVIAEEALSVELEVIKVETDEDAHALQFVGSPTIWINDQDIVPPNPDAPFALACRAYQWEDGRISPLPSPDMIRKAIQKAIQKTH